VNRHDKRRAARQARCEKFHAEYVSHLPELPPNAALEPVRVYHIGCFHDSWCSIYSKDNGTLADCNCNPVVKRYVEPRRS
jgi:hypothetical protein